MKHGAGTLIAALALSLAAAQAQAADFGLGAAFNDEETILVPIRTQGWLIEPELSLSTFSSASGGAQTSKTVRPGIGLYLRQERGSQLETYWGARASYDSNKQTFPGNEITNHTWRLTPTFGAQYLLSKQFSVGLDVGLEYRDAEQKASVNSVTTSSSSHGWQSVARILVRAFFW